VSENISGRMAFKANSLQGSLVVLGTRDALDLPEVKGRAVWNFGATKVIVQAPYMAESEVKECAEMAKREHLEGQRELLTPLLTEEAKPNNKESEIGVTNIKPRSTT